MPERGSFFVESQPCVKAINSAKLHPKLKKEVYAFIKRNILPDCGRVPPNCLKAHMIKTAKSLNLKEEKIEELKSLFNADVGYKGYYLDAGKLKKI